MGDVSVSRSELLARSVCLRAGTGDAEASVVDTLRGFLEEVTHVHSSNEAARFALSLDVTALPVIVEPAFLAEVVTVITSYRASFEAVATMRILVRPGMQAFLTRLGVAAVVFPMPVSVEEVEDNESDDDAF